MGGLPDRGALPNATHILPLSVTQWSSRDVYEVSTWAFRKPHGRLNWPWQLVETVRKMWYGAPLVSAGKLSREKNQSQ